MLVITNPATLAAANTFAAARQRGRHPHARLPDRRRRGPDRHDPDARSRRSSATGSTSSLCIRPSYVTIMGDDDLVPTFPGHQRHPVRPAVLDEERHRRAAGPRGRPHPRQRPGRGRRPRSTRSSTTRTRRRPGRCSARRRSPRSSRTTTTTARRTARSSRSPRRVRNGLVARGVDGRPHLRRHPDDNPQQFNDGTDAAGRAAEADVRLGRRRRRRQRRVERGPLHGRPPRPRLVGRLGPPGLQHGRTSQALTNGSEPAGRAEHQLLERRLRLRRDVVRERGARQAERRRGRRRSATPATRRRGTTRRSRSASSTRCCRRVLPGEGPATKQRVGDALITRQDAPGRPLAAVRARASPAATATPATSSTCGTTSATRRCRCGAAGSIRSSSSIRAVHGRPLPGEIGPVPARRRTASR